MVKFCPISLYKCEGCLGGFQRQLIQGKKSKNPHQSWWGEISKANKNPGKKVKKVIIKKSVGFPQTGRNRSQLLLLCMSGGSNALQSTSKEMSISRYLSFCSLKQLHVCIPLYLTAVRPHLSSNKPVKTHKLRTLC